MKKGKITNPNPDHHGTQMTEVSVMLGRCSGNNQHGGIDQHPANVGCSYFRHTSNNAFERHQRKNGQEKTKKMLFTVNSKCNSLLIQNPT